MVSMFTSMVILPKDARLLVRILIRIKGVMEVLKIMRKIDIMVIWVMFHRVLMVLFKLKFKIVLYHYGDKIVLLVDLLLFMLISMILAKAIISYHQQPAMLAIDLHVVSLASQLHFNQPPQSYEFLIKFKKDLF